VRIYHESELYDEIQSLILNYYWTVHKAILPAYMMKMNQLLPHFECT
jgi:hypothetical protein